MDQKELDALPETGVPAFALFEPIEVIGNDGRRWLVGTVGPARGLKWKHALPSSTDEPASDIPAFASGLKAHLRRERDWSRVDPRDPYLNIDWAELDAAIDAFAAEFQRGKG